MIAIETTLRPTSPLDRRQSGPAAGGLPGPAFSGYRAGRTVVRHDAERLRITALPGYVNRLAFSPDSRLLLFGDGDGVLVLTAAEDGRVIRCISAHTWGIRGVVFAPEGHAVLSCGDDGTIRLHAVADGSELRCLHGHDGAVLAAAIAPDGSRVLSLGADGTVRLWDLHSGRETRRFAGPGGCSGSLAFAPDGRLALVGGRDGARLLDLAAGRELRRVEHSPTTVHSVAFAPDGTKLLIGGLGTLRDGCPLLLAEVATGKLVCEFRNGHGRSANQAVFSPEGSRIYSGGLDGSVRVWDAETGRELYRFETPGSLAPIAPVTSIAVSPGGRQLAASQQGVIRIWNCPA